MWDYYKFNHPGSKYYHVHDKETGERFAAHPESEQHLYDIDDEEQGWEPEIASKYQEGMSKALKGLSTKARIKIKSPFIDSLSQEDLHALHKDNDWEVRREVAIHPNTRHDTLHALHTDGDLGVRYAVAKNSKTRDDTLHVLSTDGEDYISRAAKEALEKRGLL
jgi:hypothetical protein